MSKEVRFEQQQPSLGEYIRGSSGHSVIDHVGTALKYGLGIVTVYALNSFPKVGNIALPAISLVGVGASYVGIVTDHQRCSEDFTAEGLGFHSTLRVIQAFTIFKFRSLALKAEQGGGLTLGSFGLRMVMGLSSFSFLGGAFLAWRDAREEGPSQGLKTFGCFGLGLYHPVKL